MKKNSATPQKNAPKTSRQQLELPSDVEGIHLIEKLIETISAAYRLNEDHYGNILVAVTEAVNNAIHHGNKAHPGKKVHVGFETTPKTISFIVQDEGNGFDYTNIPDPTDPENLEKPAGRGIFLMKHLADKIEFSEKGSCVSLSFNFKMIAN